MIHQSFSLLFLCFLYSMFLSWNKRNTWENRFPGLSSISMITSPVSTSSRPRWASSTCWMKSARYWKTVFHTKHEWLDSYNISDWKKIFVNLNLSDKSSKILRSQNTAFQCEVFVCAFSNCVMHLWNVWVHFHKKQKHINSETRSLWPDAEGFGWLLGSEAV